MASRFSHLLDFLKDIAPGAREESPAIERLASQEERTLGTIQYIRRL